MIFYNDFKYLVRFIITSVKIHRSPWYGVVCNDVKGKTQDSEESHPDIKKEWFYEFTFPPGYAQSKPYHQKDDHNTI